MHEQQRQPSMKPSLQRFPQPKTQINKTAALNIKGILIAVVFLSMAAVEEYEKLKA